MILNEPLLGAIVKAWVAVVHHENTGPSLEAATSCKKPKFRSISRPPIPAPHSYGTRIMAFLGGSWFYNFTI